MNRVWKVALAFVVVFAAVQVSMAQAQTAQTGNGAGSRAIGTIVTASGNNLSLKTDLGVTVNITVQDGARVVRIEPGQTNLSAAVPIQLSEIQVGDRVLASGAPGSDQHAILANSVVAIKKADVASKQQQDLQEWTRRGVGGLVASVDPTAGTVSLRVAAAGGADKTVTVHTAKNTTILRYAPDSVKFSDTKASTLDAIKPGDQLLARGTRSTDGNDVTADAIVSGAFRNLSGTISSLNTAENQLTLTDLATKRLVTVKVTMDSQMKKLPVQAATALGARMKAQASGGNAQAAAGGAAGANDSGEGGGRGFGRGGRGGAAGAGDLSQLIARAPAVALAELQKGDAVMIVATEGAGGGPVSAITLVAGVEPILEASPTASMNLPAWNVGGGGDAGGGPTE